MTASLHTVGPPEDYVPSIWRWVVHIPLTAAHTWISESCGSGYALRPKAEPS